MDNKWRPIVGIGRDNSNDAWVNNPTKNRIELGTNSNGQIRLAGTEFVITDDGNLGINVTNPSKRIEVDLSTNSNQYNSFRILNLKSNPVTNKDLVIDNNGFVGVKTEQNVTGQIQRFPIAKIETVNALETKPILIDSDINSGPNLINTITSPFTPHTSKTGITLPEGIYKLEIKILGYFDLADVNNSVEVKTLVNGLEYSSQHYGSNTNVEATDKNYNGFTVMDFIELKEEAEIDFTIKNNVNSFTVVDYIEESGRRIYGSLILIQRLK